VFTSGDRARSLFVLCKGRAVLREAADIATNGSQLPPSPIPGSSEVIEETMTTFSAGHWIGEEAILSAQEMGDSAELALELCWRQGTCIASEWSTCLELCSSDFATVVTDLGMLEEVRKLVSLCRGGGRSLGCTFCHQVVHRSVECPSAEQTRSTVTTRSAEASLGAARQALTEVVAFLDNSSQPVFEPPRDKPFSFVPAMGREEMQDVRQRLDALSSALYQVAQVASRQESDQEVLECTGELLDSCNTLLETALDMARAMVKMYIEGFADAYLNETGTFEVSLQNREEVVEFAAAWAHVDPYAKPTIAGLSAPNGSPKWGNGPSGSSSVYSGPSSVFSTSAASADAKTVLVQRSQKRLNTDPEKVNYGAREIEIPRRSWFVPAGAQLLDHSVNDILTVKGVSASNPLVLMLRCPWLDMIRLDLQRKQVKYREVYSVVTDYLVKSDPEYPRVTEVLQEYQRDASAMCPSHDLQQGSDVHTASPVLGLAELMSQAVKCQGILREAVVGVAAEVGGVPLLPGMKRLSRVFEKAELCYNGRVDRVLDIARASIEVQLVEQIEQCVELFDKSEKLNIVRVKDRFAHPTAGGWSDLQLNVSFNVDGPRHIGEIQIVHKHLMLVRRNMGAHEEYSQFRGEQEILELSTKTTRNRNGEPVPYVLASCYSRGSNQSRE